MDLGPLGDAAVGRRGRGDAAQVVERGAGPGGLIAAVGVAVRNWVAYYGAYLNVHTDLAPFRRLRSIYPDAGPMTSLERERRGPLRPSLVRERLVEHFAARFGFARTTLFFDSPALGRKAPSDAVAARR